MNFFSFNFPFRKFFFLYFEGHPDDYLGYRDFYELFCKFYDKINFDSDDSDSDSDDSVNIEDILSG